MEVLLLRQDIFGDSHIQNGDIEAFETIVKMCEASNRLQWQGQGKSQMAQLFREITEVLFVLLVSLDLSSSTDVLLKPARIRLHM